MQGWNRKGARGISPKRSRSGGQVERGVLGLAVLAASACAPGKLTKAQEKAFNKALKEHFGAVSATASAPASVPGPDAGPPPSASQVAQISATASTTAPLVDAAGPGPLDASLADAGPPVVPECVRTVFATSCAGGACHYGNGLHLSPNLERDDLANLLSHEGPTCEAAQGAYFLDLAEPLNSYLRKKIRNEQPTGCGDVMPPVGQPALTEPQLQCLEDWFASIP